MNKKNILFTVLFTIVSFGIDKAQTIDSLYEVGTWQGFKSAAVSFTFDDNCPNQLSVAMPLFDRYIYSMTLFTVINWNPNWAALRQAAKKGHEIASHTVSHTKLDLLSDEKQIEEFKNSKDTIESYISYQKCITIAYPNCVSGNSSNCSQYYIAARGCSGEIVPNTPPDFMNISSIVCGTKGSVQTAADYINKTEAAAFSNGWVVFLIHAVDDEPGYSPVNSAELKSALEYLNNNDDKYWVTSFGNAALYIKERDNVSIEEIFTSESKITCFVNDGLDNSIFKIPVTIRRKLPDDWDSAKVLYNGRTLESKIINENFNKYVLFDVAPDSGNVQIMKE